MLSGAGAGGAGAGADGVTVAIVVVIAAIVVTVHGLIFPLSVTCALMCVCVCCGAGETPGSTWSATPRADRTPAAGGSERMADTPGNKRSSRWDETPGASQRGSATPLTPGTPSDAAMRMTPGKTPSGAAAMNIATPSPGQLGSMTPEQLQAMRWEQEIDQRNRPLLDEELDAMLPKEGYKVCILLGTNSLDGTLRMRLFNLWPLRWACFTYLPPHSSCI